MSGKPAVTAAQLEDIAAQYPVKRIPELINRSEAWLNGLSVTNKELHAAYRRGRDRYKERQAARKKPAPIKLESETPAELFSPALCEAIMTAVQTAGPNNVVTVKYLHDLLGGDVREVYVALNDLVRDKKLLKNNGVYILPEQVWDDPLGETVEQMTERVVACLRQRRYLSIGQLFHHLKLPMPALNAIVTQMVEADELIVRDVTGTNVYCLPEFDTDLPLFNNGDRQYSVREETVTETAPIAAPSQDNVKKAVQTIKSVLEFAADTGKPTRADAAFDALAQGVQATSTLIERIHQMPTVMLVGGESVEVHEIAQNFSYNIGRAIELIANADEVGMCSHRGVQHLSEAKRCIEREIARNLRWQEMFDGADREVAA